MKIKVEHVGPKEAQKVPIRTKCACGNHMNHTGKHFR
jgi:hypothetical protein